MSNFCAPPEKHDKFCEHSLQTFSLSINTALSILHLVDTPFHSLWAIIISSKSSCRLGFLFTWTINLQVSHGQGSSDIQIICYIQKQGQLMWLQKLLELLGLNRTNWILQIWIWGISFIVCLQLHSGVLKWVFIYVYILIATVLISTLTNLQKKWKLDLKLHCGNADG